MVDEMKPIHPMAPRPRWPFTRRQIIGQVIVAAVILASGIGIGVGGTILSLKGRIIKPQVDGPLPPGPPEWLIDRWRANLSLTDQQVQQIKDMFGVRMAAAREQWKKMMELQRQEQEQFVASMKSILTPEQFTKWEDDFKRHMEHFGRRGPGGPGGPGRKGKFDRPGDPNRPEGPDGHRDRGFRDMRGPDGPPPDGPMPVPDGPMPDGPEPGSPPAK